ncbi:hypothetical protein Zmor_028019 [Zophobas morio]|uniref:RNA-directed DNA polymerase n=1 Tax=Zophobas morio TaxID=2755281 RepID=A0AA38M3J0_9CUCU|nr:hypothetical protein Zmor_028019 [Zophobas morio]
MVRSIAGSVDSPTISGKINGRESKIIIDTGAEVSLARRSRLQNCQIKSVYTATNVKTVTGETTPVLGTAVVNVELGRLRIKHEVLVAEIADDFILGMDLISRYGLMIDPEQKILRFGAEEFVLGRPNVEGATVRLVVCQTTKVDGNAEVIVPARVETNPGYSLGMVQPARDSTHKLLIASTLVKTDRDIPLRVANVFPNAVSIRKGEIIGMCEPVARVLNCEEEDVENESKEGDTKGLEVNWDQLSARERKLAKGLIRRHRNVFVSEEEPFGKTNILEHRINTGDTQPIRQAPRRLPLAKQEEATRLVDNMLRDGVIEESNSAWSSPVVLVTKKDGTTRFCVDYRKLNDVTKKDSYPLPRIDDTLTTLSGSAWFSTLDLKSGYWQVGLHPDDKEKTAFSTGSGLYHFTVMPFGLCNAPATFERLMEMVLKGLTWKTCLVYLDDVMIMGKTFDDHLKNLEEVLERMEKARLKLNPKKCSLFQKRVEFLGHIVSEKGIETNPTKALAIRDWPIPRDKHELRSFLGLCTYYRRFVEGYADIAAPLHQLMEQKATFKWSSTCEMAFKRLKTALCTSPILAYPRDKGMFVLDTDASNSGIGAVLPQIQDGEERVIEYFSKLHSKPERNYCATRKELLAIVKAVNHFHKYLYGQEFLIRTDHAALSWLLRIKNPEGQVARWLERLQQYHFRIKHRAGRLHNNADALSRRPCGECKHCDRIDAEEGNLPVRRTIFEQDEEWTSAVKA